MTAVDLIPVTSYNESIVDYYFDVAFEHNALCNHKYTVR